MWLNPSRKGKTPFFLSFLACYKFIQDNLQYLFFLTLLKVFNKAAAKTKFLTLRLIVRSHPIEVEIAATPALRKLGLMYRNFLPVDHGMLFIYPKANTYSMWMHNTNIPLSVAFIDEQGIIVNIADMLPNTNNCHCAVSPVRYAIEMQSGWFHEKGIIPGAQIKGLEKAPIGR